ncbi:MAG: hypothetical protein SGJ19_06245, partial [Planctomycetia bacterium]|nr:hypothetical protein [Planctomycetia bacterium]
PELAEGEPVERERKHREFFEVLGIFSHGSTWWTSRGYRLVFLEVAERLPGSPVFDDLAGLFGEEAFEDPVGFAFDGVITAHIRRHARAAEAADFGFVLGVLAGGGVGLVD